MQCDDGERKTFRIKRRIILFILCLVCCFSIAGCGDEENRQEETAVENTGKQAAEEPTEGSDSERIAGSTEVSAGGQIAGSTGSRTSGQTKEPAEESEKEAIAAPGLSAEETDAYEQMSLYIQEGFRIYGIEDAYQAYFGAVEREEEKFFCDILLEGEDELWRECISYTVDEENAWYTFQGQDERIFSGDSFWMLDEDDSFVADLRENYRYKVGIAVGTDLPEKIRSSCP